MSDVADYLINSVSDWYKRGGLAGSMGMEPVDRQIVEYQALADELKRSGASPLEQIMAQRDNPMAGAFSPENLAGKIGAALIFAGKGSKTANLGQLALAEELAKGGASRDQIWNETGWFQGPDSQWRYEIDDRGARLDMNKLPESPSVFEIADEKLGLMPDYQHLKPGLRIGNPNVKADDQRRALDWAQGNRQEPPAIPLWQAFTHPELELAYPEIQNMRIKRAEGRANGYYSGRENLIATGGGTIGSNARSTALHEMQHNIQDRENFASGGSPDFGWTKQEQYDAARQAYDDAAGDNALLAQLFDTAAPEGTRKAWDQLTEREKLEWLDPGRQRLYRRLAGEAEARNVQARRALTPEQRRAMPPWTTLDVPETDLIVRALMGTD